LAAHGNQTVFSSEYLNKYCCNHCSRHLIINTYIDGCLKHAKFKFETVMVLLFSPFVENKESSCLHGLTIQFHSST
jgi:hypothetical protein